MLNKRDIPNILLLVLITAFFFWQILSEPKELLAAGDLLSNTVFSYSFMHTTFQSFGERALWNPYFFAGKTHVGHLLYNQYYITSLLALFAYEDFFLNFVIITHFLLAGLFMYLFLRVIKLCPSSAAIGAITFMLGRHFLGYLWGEAQPVISYAYIPLVFLGVEMILQKKNIKWAILTGIFISLQFFSGHIQYFYYTCLALVIYILARLTYKIKRDNLLSNIKATAKYLLLAGIIFLGIIQIQLLPTLELAPLTPQSTDTLVSSYEFSARESVPFKQLLTLIIPDFFGRRIDNSYWGAPSRLIDMYAGVLPLILTLIAILFAKNRYRLPLSIILAFSLLFALGENTPFYWALHKLLPGVALFKVPGRMLMLFTFAIAALSALGSDYLLKTESFSSKFIKLLGACAILAAASSIALFLLKGPILNYGNKLLNNYYYVKYAGTNLVQSHSFEYFAAKTPIAFSYISSGLIKFALLLVLSSLAIYFTTRTRKKRLAGLLLIGVVILDSLVLTNIYDWDKMKETNYPTLGNSEDTLAQWSTIAEELNRDTRPFRVTGFPQDILAKDNLYIIAGSDSMPVYYSGKYAEYAINLENHFASEVLGPANVRYVLTQAKLDEDKFNLLKPDLIYSYCRFGANKSFNLYENKNWMPRAFMVPGSKTEDLEEQFKTITEWNFNPKEEVLLTEDLGLEGGQEYKEATVNYYSPNKAKLGVDTDKPGFLVVSETYYPGWKAYDNGEQVKIYHANYIMRALYLPAGKHNIEFVFDPMSYKIGKWITFTTLGIIGILALLLIIFRKK